MNKGNINSLAEENKKLKQNYLLLEQKERTIRVINNFAVSILQQETVDEIAWAIAKNAIAKLGFIDCVVYLLDEETDLLIQTAAHGPKNPESYTIKNPIKIPLGEGVVGTVALTGKPELILDTSKDKRYILDDEMRYSELAVPITLGRKVIGVIDSEHPDKNFYTEEHLEVMTTIALMSATRLKSAMTQEKLNRYQNELEELVEQRTVELHKVIHQLKHANADLENYAYAASHDLQEPLRTISSFLQIIRKREKNLSKESLEFMNYAIDGAKRMKQLLEGTLSYARINAVSHKVTPVDLNRVLQRVLQDLSFTINNTNAIIERPNNLPIVKGYKVLLTQLFQNLLSNAIKFSQEDVQPRIKIIYTEERAYHRFEIHDNGIGIKPEFINQIFNLFTRLHKQDFKGSGLGLSLCKRIIEKHEGTIGVTSKGLGHGTCFHFTIKKH